MPNFNTGQRGLIIPKAETPTDTWIKANRKWQYQMRLAPIPPPVTPSALLWEPVSKISVSASTITSENFTGLEGDTYDYRLVIAHTSLGTNQQLRFRFNSDAGSNYRNYFSQGYGSTAGGTVAESDAYGYATLVGTDSNYSFLTVMEVGGSSGNERSTWVQMAGMDTATTYSRSLHNSWKNTGSELTSINLIDDGNSNNYTFEAYLYRRVKATGGGGDMWEEVETIDFSARDLNSSPLDFTGLTGDTDKEYILELKDIVPGAVETLFVQFNNDAGSNYIDEWLTNSGGGLSASTTTTTSIGLLGINNAFQNAAKLRINAESGRQRSCVFEDITTNGVFRLAGVAWSNTGSELTSIKVSTGTTSSVTGRAVLYKRASTESELVNRTAIDGDFSGGKDWTSLTGDSDGLYHIRANIVDKGVDSGDLHIRVNNDSGANYARQILYAIAASAPAAFSSGTGTAWDSGLTATGQDPVAFEAYIFPLSGKYRPMILFGMGKSGANPRVNIFAGWWKNTGSGITSIKIYNSSSNAVLGEVQLSALELPA